MAYLLQMGPTTVFQNIIVFSTKAVPRSDDVYTRTSPWCTLESTIHIPTANRALVLGGSTC
jgi:hypothetical protein